MIYGDSLKLFSHICFHHPQHLAAQKSYNNLDISVGEALKQRSVCLEGVLTCYPFETMGEIIDRIAKEQVCHKACMHEGGVGIRVCKALL